MGAYKNYTKKMRKKTDQAAAWNVEKRRERKGDQNMGK